jgi:O-antigen ligase
VLAAAVPILFLHVQYQPGVSVGFGSTTANAYLSDFAVLAVAVAAIVTGVRSGFAPLRRGRWLWLAIAAFVVWTFAEVAYGHAHASSYAWHVHGVTAAKFAEYALLAPSVPLLLRERRDAVLVAWSAALWSAFATAVGVAQFFGADIFLAGTTARRQASFLSSADFAALSGGVLLLGLVAFALPRLGLPRRLAALATASGALGSIVAGAVAALLGLATAVVVSGATLLVRRELRPGRTVAIGAVAAVVAAGTLAIRGSDLDAFARFLHATPGTSHSQPGKIQTYPQRTLLVWIGYQEWRHHPWLGVGWEGSAEPANFEPYLPAAHRRFPDVAPSAFPSAAPDRRYGVQNSWVQALADLGVLGLALWVAVFGVAAWYAGRAALRRGSGAALYGLALVAFLVWLWSAQGFTAGIPLDALTWLGLGVAVAAPARVRDRAGAPA